MAEQRYAIVEAGEVTNVIVWDSEAEPKWAPGEGAEAIACPEEVSVGWTFNDGAFAPAPEIDDA